MVVLACLYGMAFLLLPTACVSLDCPVNNMVNTVYNLQKPDGTTDTMGVDTLWVRVCRTNKNDTLLINSLCGTSATKFHIPISHTQPEDVVWLEVKDTIGTLWRDTIHLQKENYPHFEGVDCKASYFHKITAVRSSHHLIDTVIINKSEVNYDASKAHFLLRLKARR